MPLEIERKFLLPEYPKALIEEGAVLITREQVIDQTYLALDGEQELRVRKIKDLATGELKYTHTFKRGFGLAREEVEYDISAGLYEQMIHIRRAVPLVKKRITASWNGVSIEIDDYRQINMLVLEVEFGSEEEALNFDPPGWFGPDISTDKQYSNKKVWRDLQSKW
ncbi:CYTH domain-containing protein [Fontibacillus phaseoli]|uniref:CYTH domain-containing protein n=1 Tax=Fontibacillus phaseoli TaxID=1416533 RepID=A0A369BGZ7_9BACL|nr:CYTH domain-containing protein [Fontibacillus phaseoli]RCX20681.1 CYTH domain-containing protein [Fontibacillus phaseoli]